MDKRLMQVLISEKRFDSQKINNVLASDIFKVLQNYMDIERDDVHVKLDLDNEGFYVLKCKVNAKRIKIFGIM